MKNMEQNTMETAGEPIYDTLDLSQRIKERMDKASRDKAVFGYNFNKVCDEFGIPPEDRPDIMMKIGKHLDLDPKAYDPDYDKKIILKNDSIIMKGAKRKEENGAEAGYYND